MIGRGWVGGRMGGRVDGWADGRTDGQTDGQMDGCAIVRTYVRKEQDAPMLRDMSVTIQILPNKQLFQTYTLCSYGFSDEIWPLQTWPHDALAGQCCVNN